jgi:hypothetical protein
LKKESILVRKIALSVRNKIRVFSIPDMIITAFPLSHKNGLYKPATMAVGNFLSKPIGLASVNPISNE